MAYMQPDPEAYPIENDEEEWVDDISHIPPLPGHKDHACTDAIWIIVFLLAVAGLYWPAAYANEHGDPSKFIRGFDFMGRMCGRDWCGTGVCGPNTFYCMQGLNVDVLHPICVDDCPSSNATSTMCFDRQTNGSVLLPDYPTVEYNRKCLSEEVDAAEKQNLDEKKARTQAQRANQTEEERKQNEAELQLEETFDMIGAASIQGILMDGVGSISKAAWTLVLSLIAATLCGCFYMVFLNYFASFLIYVSLMLMMVVPLGIGSWSLWNLYSTGFSTVFTDVEAQRSAFFAVVFLILGTVACCLQNTFARGIQTATATISATCECMFEVPSIMIEPIMSILTRVSLAGPLACCLFYLAASGTMVLHIDEEKGMHRSVVFDDVLIFYMVYVVFMTLWVLEIGHHCTQDVLAYCVQRWYFTPVSDSGRDAVASEECCCMALEGVINCIRYHWGSIIFGALMKFTLRGPYWVARPIDECFFPKAASEEARQTTGGQNKRPNLFKRAVIYLNYLAKIAYMDMALTSSNYCMSAPRAHITMESAAQAEAVLNGTQIVFQVAGWMIMASIGALTASFAINSYAPYSDPTSDEYLPDPLAVVECGAIIGFLAGLSFMNVFDVVGDTILYCFAVEEQRFGQGSCGDMQQGEAPIFSACSRRGIFDYLTGNDEEEEQEQVRVKYAPSSLKTLLDNRDA